MKELYQKLRMITMCNLFTVGSGWDSQNSLGSGSTWLVLRNLTPQIDGATLKTLCSQHGPLLNFFVNQNNGQALVQYATRLEGQKAHKSLNSCVLGNTTIMTEFVDESEVCDRDYTIITTTCTCLAANV